MSDPVPPSRAPDGSEQAISRRQSWTSDLHASLDSSEARASELRQELDDLRRSLDAAPGGEPGRHRRPRSRRMALGAVSGTVLVLAAGVGLAVRGSGRDAGPTAAGATSTASAARSPASTSVARAPSTTAPVTARETRRAPQPAGAVLPSWPGATGPEPPGLPAHGVGSDLPGTEVTAALAADRTTVEVYERALLAPAGSTLTLRVAASPEIARSLRAAPPTVQDVHVAVDGRSVPATRTRSGWTVPIAGTRGVTHLTLRYRLSGAVVRTEPAPRGRYTLVLTPLTATGDGGGATVVVRISDPRVAEVYCPATANQLCGREEGEVHIATVPAGAVPVVIGLVTFPS
ncbi:MAG TPA: hypothetical protein VEV65_12700 [Kineosporiaceae bacterium]|nr:hypothetical protein [Kineosporiaceae bacterium]